VITVLHGIVCPPDAAAVRAFFRDTLGWPHVDAGDGWLIFKTPPTELAAHPDPEGGRHELFLMCDDIEATVDELRGRGARIDRPVSDQGFGLLTYIELPGGGSMGLYQPKHPTAI